MKILIYTHAFAPQVGGVESVVMLLAQGLVSVEGAAGGPPAVIVVTPTAPGDFDDTRLPFRVVRRPSLRQLMKLIRAADVVHLAGPALLPLLLARLARKAVVVEHHGFQAICPNGQFVYEPKQTLCPGYFMARRYAECLRCNAKMGRMASFKLLLLTFPRRWLCRGSAVVNLTPTKWLDTLLQLPRTTTIHHGVPDTGPSPVTAVPSRRLTFAFLGRLVSAKGPQVLLEAAAEFRARGAAFRLKVIGEGPERPRLEARAAALGIRDSVSFFGYLPPDRLELELENVAAVILPSLGGEVFGMAAAENMMRGHLVVVSDIGSLAEVVGEEGLKFRSGDAAALADCLQQILNRPELASNLGGRARARALLLFRTHHMVAQHLQVYGSLLDRGAH